ncbi:podocalyxin-like protein 2 isoform 2-T2 [Discoglossus pictus]
MLQHLLFGSLCLLLVACEEPSSEGLTSTSLLDLPSSHQETLDSAEHGGEGYQESDVLPGLLHTSQGSGLSSQETEDSSILQSPQYFWDEEVRKVNGTSAGPSWIQTDYPVPKNIHGAEHGGIEGNNNPPKEYQEPFTPWWPTESEETTRLLSSVASIAAEEETMWPSIHDEKEFPPVHHKERIEPKTIPTVPTNPFTKPPRKNKTHSKSKSHQVKHDQGSNAQLGFPTTSHGFLTTDVSTGHRQEENESLLTHSPDMSEELNETRFTNQISRDIHERPSVAPTEVLMGSEQVICKDWINLAGKNYVILNMSDDIDCEQFRWQKGQQLLSLLEGALSWKEETPQKDWVIALSKPNENDNHLLMTITEEQRVVPIKDVFNALGDIKRNLAEIGIESYTSTVDCQSRPNLPRSDYGKLFIVLVIIGSICVMIIIAGMVYICWQRRLPKLKNMLHFVENGCHDNPTLDVAMDGQSEMQEKKPSLNGGTSLRADGWETLINNEGAKEEGEAMEEDTHL